MKTTARRGAAAGVVSACLLSVSVPALAADFPVTIDTDGGTRQFSVLDAGGSPLVQLDFGQDRAMPFQVVVQDGGMPLLGNDFTVSAQLSNLYLENTDGTTDYSAVVPSSSLSLSYGGNPLGASGIQLPVVPELTLGGTLTCDGLTPTPLSTLATVCSLIAGLTEPLSSGVAGPAVPLDEADIVAALEGLDLSALPLSITGGQERGRFTTPAKRDADDPVDGVGATSKTLLAGTNLLTGDTLADALARVDAVLRDVVEGGPVLPTEGSESLLDVETVLDAVSQQSAVHASIAGLLRTLPADQVLTILGGVTATLDAVGLAQLSSLTGTWTSSPVLEAQPVTTRPGTYAGTMTVDFFQP